MQAELEGCVDGANSENTTCSQNMPESKIGTLQDTKVMLRHVATIIL